MRLTWLAFLSWCSTINGLGIQSGPNLGPLYAAQVVVDSANNKAMITGITYDESFGHTAKSVFDVRAGQQSSCFVATLQLPNLKFQSQASYGSPSTLEACRSIAIVDGKKALVTGVSEPGGLYHEPGSAQTAFGMLVDRNSLAIQSGQPILQDGDPVPYPVAIQVDNGDIYISSMFSKTDELNEFKNEAHPNWTHENKHGRHFEMMIEKRTANLSNNVWTSKFPIQIDEGGVKPSVFVSGMILKQNKLVVVGTTRGKGEGYGHNVAQDSDDEDGFFSVLDPNSGNLIQSGTNQKRIGTQEDDVISGICHDPSESGYFYIVGASQGTWKAPNNMVSDTNIPSGSLQPFVKKINLETLETEWSTSFGAQKGGAITKAYALGCTVVTDDVIYVGGVVENGASMMIGTHVKPSYGGDDVWVSQIDVDNGNVFWVNQIGSSGNDYLARGGGVAWDPKNKNAIVYGDTTGNMYHDRSDSQSELFLVSLDYDNGGTPETGDALTDDELYDDDDWNDDADDDQDDDDSVDTGTLFQDDDANDDWDDDDNDEDDWDDDVDDDQDDDDSVDTGTLVQDDDANDDWDDDYDDDDYDDDDYDDDDYDDDDWDDDADDDQDDDDDAVAANPVPGFDPDNINAIQTGPDVGPSYAGGMTYDRNTNSLFITGATYGAFSGPGIHPKTTSSCFFGVVNLPRMEWQQREVYGSDSAPEACNSIAMNEGSSGAIIVGSTEPTGLLTDLTSAKSSTADQYGMVLDVVKQAKYEFLGGTVIGDSPVNYPVAVAADTNQGRVYVVSLAATDTKVTANYKKVAKKEYPNFTKGGIDIEKYGSESYEINLESFTMQSSSTAGGASSVDLQETLALNWKKPLELDGGGFTYASGMVLPFNSNEVIIVGSIRSHTGGDMDGIIIKVNRQDGSFSTGTAPNSKPVEHLASKSGKDDWIKNVCLDPNDASSFYVVGATNGNINQRTDRTDDDVTVHGLVAKMSLDSLETIWVTQFPVSHHSGSKQASAAAAFGCDVILGDELMYVAGTVENGATIDFTGTKSTGQDDIFVAQVNTKSGVTQWLKQIGSNGNDRVARGGGIVADANRNAVVFGDTSGDFFRSRSKDPHIEFSDIFMFVLDYRDGFHQTPLVGPARSSSSESGSSNGITPQEWYASTAAFAKTSSGAMVFGIIGAITGALVLGCCFWGRMRTRKEGKNAYEHFFFLFRICTLTHSFIPLFSKPTRN